MKYVFSIACLVLLSITSIEASNIDPADETILKVDQIDNKVLIEFLRDSDLLMKRPILIFDDRGNQIFKSNAKKHEKITEINMTNVKEGNYTIKMVLADKSIDIAFTKE